MRWGESLTRTIVSSLPPSPTSQSREVEDDPLGNQLARRCDYFCGIAPLELLVLWPHVAQGQLNVLLGFAHPLEGPGGRAAVFLGYTSEAPRE